MTLPETYTVEEAAAFLKVDRRTVYRYIETGKLKANKGDGRYWLILEDDLLAFAGIRDKDGE